MNNKSNPKPPIFFVSAVVRQVGSYNFKENKSSRFTAR